MESAKIPAHLVAPLWRMIDCGHNGGDGIYWAHVTGLAAFCRVTRPVARRWLAELVSLGVLTPCGPAFQGSVPYWIRNPDCR